MSETYLYRKGAMTLGPFTLDQMRRFAQQGQIGRSHQISVDGGQSWQSGSEMPAIFTAPESPSFPPMTAEIDEFSIGGGLETRSRGVELDLQGNDDSEPPRPPKRRRQNGTQAVLPDAGVNTAGLSGFICSIVAIIMLLIPCMVWLLIAQSFFWIFYAVIPLAALAVIGLVLSTVGLFRPGRRLATAGMVLGVIAVLMAVMAIVAATTIRYRMTQLRSVQIAAAKTEIELSRKAIADSLSAFRNLRQDPDEDEELFGLRQRRKLQDVGMHLGNLVEHYRDYLSATSMTSEFGVALQAELPKLRSTVVEIQQALKSAEMTLEELMQDSMSNIQLLKTLDGTLALYQGGKITIDQAEAKLAGQ